MACVALCTLGQVAWGPPAPSGLSEAWSDAEVRAPVRAIGSRPSPRVPRTFCPRTRLTRLPSWCLGVGRDIPCRSLTPRGRYVSFQPYTSALNTAEERQAWGQRGQRGLPSARLHHRAAASPVSFLLSLLLGACCGFTRDCKKHRGSRVPHLVSPREPRAGRRSGTPARGPPALGCVSVGRAPG